MKNGCLRGLPLASIATGDFCHSYQPCAGHQAASGLAAALANAPFSSTDSARALIIRIPTLMSLAQLGTRPHVSSRSWRTGAGALGTGVGASWRSLARGTRDSTTGACLLGARL